MRTAIDTNILSALLTGEVNAVEVGEMLNTGRDRGGLVICPIVYVELRAAPGTTVSLIDNFLERTSKSSTGTSKNKSGNSQPNAMRNTQSANANKKWESPSGLSRTSLLVPMPCYRLICS